MPQEKKNFFDQFDAPVSQGMQVKPADPTLPAQATKANNEARASNYAPGNAQADLEGQRLTNEGIRLQNEARRMELQGGKLGEGWRLRPDGTAEPIPGYKPKEAASDGKDQAMTALQQQVDHVRELWQQRIQGGAPNPIWGHVGTSANTGFDSASQGLTNPFMAAFRIAGAGSQSDTELKQFIAANVPQPTDTDAAIEEKLGNIQRRIDAMRPPEQLDRSAALPGVSDSTSGMGLARGNTKAEIDPILRGVGTKVGAMIARGVPDGEIRKFLTANGVDPSVTNIDSALQFRQTPQFKQWQRANPGKAYPIGPEFYTKQVPLTAPQALMNSAAQSGPGAYAISAAQAVTGNHLDDMGGGEAVNTGMEMLRRDHPTATFLGDVTGQAMFDAASSRFLPFAKLGKFAGVGVDALYGAVSGQGEGDTLGGIMSNTLGGAIGRGTHGAVTTGLRGLKPTSSLAYLNDAGVPLTIGQIGRGSGTTLGNAVGGLEDRAAGVPIFDAIINSARQRGEKGFNQAAFKEAGGSGLTGSAGVNELGQQVNNAYSFLDNASIPIDARFAGSQAGVRAGLPDLPEFGPQVGKKLNTIDKAIDGNLSLSGRDWQSALRSTRADRSSLKGAPFSDGAVNSLNDVEDNLLTLAERNGPTGALNNLAAANKQNGQYQTILSALDNGPTQARGEMFSPVRLDNASRAGARNYGGRAASMQGNRPFYDLTQAGMDVMPNQVPDSGTAGRSLMYSLMFPALVGGGMGAAGGLAADGKDGAISGGIGGAAALPFALAALYSKPGQKALQKALLGPRGAAATTLGDLLAGDSAPSNKVLGAVQKAFGRKALGQYGASTLRDLVLLPELPEQN